MNTNEIMSSLAEYMRIADETAAKYIRGEWETELTVPEIIAAVRCDIGGDTE